MPLEHRLSYTRKRLIRVMEPDGNQIEFMLRESLTLGYILSLAGYPPDKFRIWVEDAPIASDKTIRDIYRPGLVLQITKRV